MLNDMLTMPETECFIYFFSLSEKRGETMEITPQIKEDFLTFNESDTISSMIGELKKTQQRTGLVFRKDKLLGVVEKKKLLRSRLDAAKTKIGNYIHRTSTVNEHADVIETAYLMFQSDVDFLPVERNKKIFGVLSSLDLVKLAADLPEAKSFKVSDMKIIKPAKLDREDPLSMALERMYLDRIDQVPVFEKGKLYGIISFSDVFRKYMNWAPKREYSHKLTKEVGKTRGAEADRPSWANLPIQSFSTNENLVTVSNKTTLREVVSLMSKNSLSSLIVMEKGKVEGLLTVKNILRKIGSLKIPQNFNIKFVGLNSLQLEPYQKYNLKKIASNESFKLQRQIHNDFSLVLHLKEYEKEGTRQKYAVNLRVEFPGQIVAVSQDDWDPETAMRKTFDNAKNKLKKKFSGDISGKKYY